MTGDQVPDVAGYPYTFDARREVADLLQPVDRLLDVGCGSGGFAHGLRRDGPAMGEIWGIEANAAAAARAREHLDVVLTGAFPDIVPEGAQFDTIVFNDVLEHMPDPWAALVRARSLLASDGTVVASIPNVRYWPVVRDLVFRARWEYTGSGPLDRSHLRFFTRSSALAMFASAGYAVTRIDVGYTLPIGPRGLGLRLLPRDMRILQYVYVARPLAVGRARPAGGADGDGG